MFDLKGLSIDSLRLLNMGIIVISIAICAFLMALRIPGLELLGITPHWLLIWVVAWSMKRSIWQGAVAGLAIGLIYDGISVASPSHILSLVIVGVLTAKLQKQKYIGEDFISAALIVFFMAIVAETVFAIQLIWQNMGTFEDIWWQYRKIAIASAIISSLWTPALYYPLDLWWTKLDRLDRHEHQW
jgi:rod shape-determining protein MreD